MKNVPHLDVTARQQQSIVQVGGCPLALALHFDAIGVVLGLLRHSCQIQGKLRDRDGATCLKANKAYFAVRFLKRKVQTVKRDRALERVRGAVVEKKVVQAELGERGYLLSAPLDGQHGLL